MSFQAPTPRQAIDRAKLLEDVQKKQALLKSQAQGGVPMTTGSINPGSNQAFIDNNYSISTANSANQLSPGISSVSSSQRERATLHHAQQNSFGFYITQDSSFGNVILPVLPRSYESIPNFSS
ncbi:SOSS complex subunit C homolog [Brevipalpus obovatus]|uniref:SOSS complex subunit C homolog n=1 Tax=Brevipalpus obovatus TaxID=246614 RepID=UPI003D9E6838